MSVLCFASKRVTIDHLNKLCPRPSSTLSMHRSDCLCSSLTHPPAAACPLVVLLLLINNLYATDPGFSRLPDGGPETVLSLNVPLSCLVSRPWQAAAAAATECLDVDVASEHVAAVARSPLQEKAWILAHGVSLAALILGSSRAVLTQPPACAPAAWGRPDARCCWARRMASQACCRPAQP